MSHPQAALQRRDTQGERQRGSSVWIVAVAHLLAPRYVVLELLAAFFAGSGRRVAILQLRGHLWADRRPAQLALHTQPGKRAAVLTG